MSSQPTHDTCPFCGEKLKPLKVEFNGKQFRCGYEHCSCEASEIHRQAVRREKEQACKVEKEIRMRHALTKAGVKPRYLSAEHPEAERLQAMVSDERGLYIVGGVGAGKTHLASAIAREILNEGCVKVRMVSFVDLLDDLRATFSDFGKTEADVLRPLLKTDVLILDDLGKGAPTDYALSRLFQIVNTRYEQMQPIIVTTQYARPELIARLAKNGDKETAVAIVSRLSEMCEKVELEGGDRRLT